MEKRPRPMGVLRGDFWPGSYAACAKVGCLCAKCGLSPPFQLRSLAAEWVALDIPLAHCLRTIEAYLVAHREKCYSGASDRLFRH
jgi:hypothetical protein